LCNNESHKNKGNPAENMHQETHSLISSSLALIWILLFLASFLFLRLCKNAALKRKVSSYLAAMLALIPPLGFWIEGAPYYVVLGFAVFLLLYTFAVAMTLSFCDACGSTIIKRSGFGKALFCSQCGTALDVRRTPGA
jgi:hypothetical protein